MSRKNDHCYFIQQYSEDTFFHGGIGLADAETILGELNFKPIRFPYVYDFSFRAKILRLIFMLRLFFSLPSGAVLVTPFQVHSILLRFLVYKLVPLKNIHIICLICDIDGLRSGNQRLLKKEISLLKKYKYFIVHNPRMKSWISKHVKQSASSLLNLFDFLAAFEVKTRQKSKNIVFAGNLSKAQFVGQLDGLSEKSPGLKFLIYGKTNGELTTSSNNTVLKGAYEPYKLPSVIEGSFGLVWDGDSIESCDGSYGRYLQINSPHKLSFYILCGLPVIIWDQAATASFVTDNSIGILISSLFEIEDKINSVSEEDYQKMCSNTHKIARKISAGGHLQNAIEEMLQTIHNEKKRGTNFSTY